MKAQSPLITLEQAKQLVELLEQGYSMKLIS